MPSTEILDTLWRLTGEPKSDWNCHFDPAGLILLYPIREILDPPFPFNVAAFATTGGDSVHYGFLDAGSGYHDASPVVMTVPCSDEKYFVVGANLRDFLCLGCHTGYFDLEQLAYDWTASCEHLDTAASRMAPHAEVAQIINPLIRELYLTPWAQPHAEKLSRLQNEYVDLVHARLLEL